MAGVDDELPLLVCDALPETLALLATSDGVFRALNYRVHAAHGAGGVRLVEPPAAPTSASEEALADKVLEMLGPFDRDLAARSLSPGERALARYHGLRVLTAVCRVEALCGGVVPSSVVSRGRIEPWDPGWFVRECRANYVPAFVEAGPSGEGGAGTLCLCDQVVIDQRTAVSRQEPPRSEVQVLRLDHQDPTVGRERRWPGEIIWPLKLEAEGTGVPARAKAAGFSTGDDVTDLALAQLAQNVKVSTGLCRKALEAFREEAGGRVASVHLNVVWDPLQAALVEIFSGTSVPVVLETHANVSVHGRAQRRELARIIAENGFNEFPGVDVVVPRSRFHEPTAGRPVSVVSLDRLGAAPSEPSQLPVVNCDADRPFRILAAPNFLPHPAAVPLVSPDCFETMANYAALARATGDVPGLELWLRVKTTANDDAKGAELGRERAIAPEDIAPLCDLADNIRDLSEGSYRECLRAADIVVTEGISSVVFDALENRIPVLLLRHNEGFEPSIPCEALEAAIARGERSAIYHGTWSTKLAEGLRWLRTAHQDKPLNREELTGVLGDAGCEASDVFELAWDWRQQSRA